MEDLKKDAKKLKDVILQLNEIIDKVNDIDGVTNEQYETLNDIKEEWEDILIKLEIKLEREAEL